MGYETRISEQNYFMYFVYLFHEGNFLLLTEIGEPGVTESNDKLAAAEPENLGVIQGRDWNFAFKHRVDICSGAHTSSSLTSIGDVYQV